MDPQALADDFDTSFSASTSPTKPLNFPQMAPPSKPHTQDPEALDLARREFNSSSDTYVSENSERQNDENDDNGNDANENENADSFDRNFATDANFTKTISSYFVPKDIPQMDSLTTLNHPSSPTTLHHPDERSASPARLIMKNPTTPGSSPRKSVAFPDADLEVHHHYPAGNDLTSRIEDELPPQMAHTWSEVPKGSPEKLVTALPPVPPPHKSDTITSLLGRANEEDNAPDDVDAAVLSQYRVNHKNFSKMSLHEKLDLYLGLKQHDDLDNHLDHLDKLQYATANETELNIHSLSHHMELNHPEVENPLNMLADSKDVQLRSAGSSQSLLPSLAASNRYLEAENVAHQSPGLLLNDGIKGFPDHMADVLFPSTVKHQDSDESGVLTFGAKPHEGYEDEHSEISEEFQDSFDHSYNSTKQSIMDLLNSASNHELNEAVKASQSEASREVQPENHNIQASSLELPALGPLPQLEESSDAVKQEENLMVRAESEPSIKEEEESFVKQEQHSFVQQGHFEEEDEEEQEEEDDAYLMTGSPVVKHEEQSFVEETPQVKEEPQTSYIAPVSPAETRTISPESLYEEANPVKTEHYDEAEPESEFSEAESETAATGNVQSQEVSNHEAVEPSAEISRETPAGSTSEAHPLGKPEAVTHSGTSADAPSTGQIAEHLDEHSEQRMPTFDGTSSLLETKDLSKLALDHNDHTADHVGIASRGVKAAPNQVKLVKSPMNLLMPTPTVSPLDIKFNQEDTHIKDSGIEGDDEDTEEMKEKLATTHHTNRYSKIMQNQSVALSVDNFEDSSDMPLGRSLAPVKVNEVVDATKGVKRGHVGESDGDSSVLANSSNVNPPNDIKLPEVDTNDASFADLTERYRVSSGGSAKSMSFEESLSAEHDKERAALDFISIWHTQRKQRQNKKPQPSSLFYNVPSVLNYNTADLSQYDKYRIPSRLQPKKFREVNLVSKRVVSPDHVDLNVSGFLPELSQLSGLEGQFEGLMKGDDTTMNSTRILSNGSRMSTQDGAHNSSISRSASAYGTLRPVRVYSREIVTTPQPPVGPKKSRFHVPSFEIKRSNSVLSPKNQYNDIFEDTQPTIKASGMKTLPSMDRDDVKRIMQMKHSMNQEEYSKLKFGGANQRIVQDQAANYDHVQQKASLHSSMLSSIIDNRVKLQHVSNELSAKPVALDVDHETFAKAAAVPELSAKVEDVSEQSFLPDPEPEYVGFPESGETNNEKEAQPNLVPLGETDQSKLNVIPGAFNILSPSTPKRDEKNKSPVKVIISPHKDNGEQPRSPIKVNSSPIKVVRSGNSVTGIKLEQKHRNQDSYDGTQIINNKLRDGKGHKFALSTVSVPSTKGDLESEQKSLGPEVLEDNTVKAGSADQTRVASAVSEPPKERGKLFLRVMGMKNISLPDLQEKNALFNITLDNGVHCIKTPNYKMSKSAVYVGKEFELTVGESLEFILTMKATYNKPRETMKEIKERRVVRSNNKIGRMFGSKEIVTTTKFVPQEVKDPWSNVIANDGSFARCYVDLDQYVDQITGTATNFNLNCFNEWATKSGNGARYEPYGIAQLEVKMLFVPRTEPYEILPTSIKTAYESVDDLRAEKSMRLEGYLHQEGGDCESWKKRFFKLSGTNMIAHSEFSHKTRAKINLAKVVEVIYVDKENMNRSSSNYRNFSDILLVENAFKIRFANGEIIDFGAPNKDEKVKWITAIQEIVYRNKFRRQPWVKIMQKHNVGKPRPRSIMSFAS